MDTGRGFHYISLFSVRKCNYRKKTSKKLKSPQDAGGDFQYISLFSVRKCNYRKKTSKKLKITMDALAGFQYITLFSVRKCNYPKKVEKTQKSLWIQETVSITYSCFQSESVIIGKKRKNSKVPTDTGGGLQYISLFSSKKCNYIKKTSKKLKSPHGYRRRFPLHTPLFSQKV